MSGIIAYVGSEDCTPVLVEGLARLAHSDTESTAIAVHSGQELRVISAVGGRGCLASALTRSAPQGPAGIGQTRWAGSCVPHVVERVAVVVDGLVENDVALRSELETRGVTIGTTKAAELVAHLVAGELGTEGTTLDDAVRSALRRVEGAWTVAVASTEDPRTVVVAVREAALVVGHGDGATLAASDVRGVLHHASEVTLLESGDVATLTPEEARITTLLGDSVVRSRRRIVRGSSAIEDRAHAHFMLEDVERPPSSARSSVVSPSEPRELAHAMTAGLALDEIGAHLLGRVWLVGSGRSAMAVTLGRCWFEHFGKITTRVLDPGMLPSFDSDDLLVALSEGGEGDETVSAVHAARFQGARVLAIGSNVDSTMARGSQVTLFTEVAAGTGTSCFENQLAALLSSAVWFGRLRGVVSAEEARAIPNVLRRLSVVTLPVGIAPAEPFYFSLAA